MDPAGLIDTTEIDQTCAMQKLIVNRERLLRGEQAQMIGQLMAVPLGEFEILDNGTDDLRLLRREVSRLDRKSTRLNSSHT